MIAPDKPISQILNRLNNSQRPYLIAGSRASFRYHRWLSPAPKIVEVRIYSEDYDYWVNLLQGELIYISETPPTTEMVKSLDVAVLLTRNLNAKIYQNKRTFAGLYYMSPEDLCIHSLQINVRSRISLLDFRWKNHCY